MAEIESKTQSAGASAASSKHFEALVEQIRESTRNLQTSHGFTTPVVKDVVNLFDRVIQWLMNPTPAPVGPSKARR